MSNSKGDNVIPGTRRDWANQLRADIVRFREENNLERVVLVWCGSTEAFCESSEATASLAAFEKALDAGKRIPPSMVYICSPDGGCPYANGANLTVDVPAILELRKSEFQSWQRLQDDPDLDEDDTGTWL